MLGMTCVARGLGLVSAYCQGRSNGVEGRGRGTGVVRGALAAYLLWCAPAVLAHTMATNS